MNTKLLATLGLVATMLACNPPSQNSDVKPITIQKWGTYENQPIYQYVLKNENGSTVTLSNYGATITGWTFPDKKGDTSQIVIGFDSLSTYLAHPPYFGATIGRFGNRIAKGKFTLEGKQYSVATNDGPNHLHGGIVGFDKRVWTAMIPDSSQSAIDFHYISKDGEEGYPGNLDVTVHYRLTKDNELRITYDATTDKPTIINMTNHSYFNLSGNLKNTVLNEFFQIDADKYTPVANLIPTGQLASVEGTPYDFRKTTKIGSVIDKTGGCFDHNFVLNTGGSMSRPAGALSDTSTGRTLTVFTTQPGIQFYVSCYLKGEYMAHGNQPTIQYAGATLETQHFPDSPNQPNFPSVELKPGDKYHEETIYKIELNK